MSTMNSNNIDLGTIEVYDNGKYVELPIVATHFDGQLIEVRDLNGDIVTVESAILHEDGSIHYGYCYSRGCDYCDGSALGCRHNGKAIYVFQ